MKPRCEGCKHWVRGPEPYLHIWGECHGAAPAGVGVLRVRAAMSTRIDETQVLRHLWPMTRQEDFCREHDPLPVEEEEAPAPRPTARRKAP